MALPVELNNEQRNELIYDFSKSLAEQGMIVDYSIHNPPDRDDLGRPLDQNGFPTTDPAKMQFRNPHCHIMIPIRPLADDGKFTGKSTTEYVCKNLEDGSVARLTQQELLKSKVGWQKMFLCESNGSKKYLTKTEIEQGLGKRIGRNALMTRHGRPSEEYAYRLSAQFVKDIRVQ